MLLPALVLLSMLLDISTPHLRAAGPTAWDLSANFTVSANPNGAWSYGQFTNASGFQLFTNAVLAGPAIPVDFWATGRPSTASVARNALATPWDSTVAPTEHWGPHQVGMHPGSDGASPVVRWTCPHRGFFIINAIFSLLDSGASADAHIKVNGVEAYGNSAVSTPGSFRSVTELLEGDTVDFVVGWGLNGNYGQDNLGLAAQVAEVPPCVNVPTNGLISWWRADGDPSDALENHPATFNSADYWAGIISDSFRFDGSERSVELGSWFNLQEFTISFWINPAARQSNGYANIIDNNHTAGRSWVLQQDGLNNNHFAFGAVGTPTTILNFDLSAREEWSHLAVTRRLENGLYVARGYLNGEPTGESSTSTTAIFYDGTQSLRLGNWGQGGRALNGLVDETMVFNRALSQGEIRTIFDYAVNGGICNHPPVALNDDYTAAAGIDLNVASPGVLSNDYDPEQQSLTAAIVSPPSHGTASVNPNGSFVYSPAAGFSGTDSFSYVASDGTLQSPPTVVTITVSAPIQNEGPSFEIGEIPFQFANSGTELRFHVQSPSLSPDAVITAAYANPPNGTIRFANGTFSYTPGNLDKYNFTVTFTSSSSSGSVSQPVTISPTVNLPPDQISIGVEQRPLPDAEAQEFILEYGTGSSVPEVFNYVSRSTTNVIISAKRLVFVPGHENSLYERYAQRSDIRSIELNADELVIGGPLHWASAEVTVHARSVQFQDRTGHPPASITTTPDNPLLPNPPQESAPGADGLSAGTIHFLAKEYQQNGSPGTPRLILRGGTAQNGGPGHDGSPAIDRTMASGSTDPHVTAVAVHFQLGDAFKNITVGPNKYPDQDGDEFNIENYPWRPENGGDSAPDGVPGFGGAGGKLETMLPMIAFDSRGGASGSSKDHFGAAAGQPNPAYFDIIYFSWPDGQATLSAAAINNSKAGTDSRARKAVAPFGPAGLLLPANAPYGWLSPNLLRAVLVYGKKAYLQGHSDEAAILFDYYTGILNELEGSRDWALRLQVDQLEFTQLASEMQVIQHRIASGLDYFGNPPGWAPLLSLEANFSAFNQEVDPALRILYVNYWLGAKITSLQEKLAAIETARSAAKTEISQKQVDFVQASATLPALQARASILSQQTSDLQGDLQHVQDALLAQAKSNVEPPFWKKVTKVLGTICSFIPLPVTQGIAVAANFADNFDASKPWDSILKLPNLISDLSSDNLEKAATAELAQLPKIPNLDNNDLKGVVGELQKSASSMKSIYSTTLAKLRDTGVPKNEVDAELARLKATSPAFNDLTDRIAKLMAEKQALGEQAAQITQELGTLHDDITVQLLAVDSFNRLYAADAGAVDLNRAAAYLAEMARRAQERLLHYQYLVKKAYEYRMLEPYPYDLDLNDVFDSFVKLADKGIAPGSIPPDEFKNLRGLYDATLSWVIHSVIDRYNDNPPESAAPVRYPLSSAELQELNTTGEVSLNFKALGLFKPDEESVRIVKVRALSAVPESVPAGLSFGYADLTLEHGGESILNKGGKEFRFLHYNRRTDNPITWASRVDLITQNIDNVGPSPSAESLLHALLLDTPPDMQLFASPGGWADLTLKKSVNPANVDVAFKSILLEVTYEFVPRASTSPFRVLQVDVNDGLAPLLTVTHPDIEGRQDGYGSFRRYFPKGQSVTVSAPNRVGAWQFVQFTRASGQGVPDQPLISVLQGDQNQLAVTIGNDTEIHALYSAPVAPHLSITIGADGSQTLLLEGMPNSLYVIESTESLKPPVWSPFTTVPYSAPAAMPVPPTGVARFFRARSQ
jgi:hypothetical protein